MIRAPSTFQTSRYDRRRMSLGDYEALPEEKPYLEYWDGVVLQKAVPKRKHRRLAKRLVVALDAYERAVGGDSGPEGHVWFEGRGYLVPDVVYWAAGKPQGDNDRSLPPTLAVEIRSPGQSLDSLRAKCREMSVLGVDLCWLVDPDSQTVERFAAGADIGALSSGDLTGAALPGFSLPFADLFAGLDR